MPDWLDKYKADLDSGNVGIADGETPAWLADFEADTEAPVADTKGKIGFWENVERGGWGGFFDKVTLGVKPMIEAGILYDRVNRVQSLDYEPTDEGWGKYQADREKIFEYLEEQAEIQERGLSKGAKIGNIVGQMLPFMVEFIATGGVASLGKKAVSKGVLNLVTRMTGKQVGKGLVRKATANLAGWVTSAGIRTALTPHRTLKAFIDERMPDIQISPEGQLIFEESADSPFRSAYKAIGNQFIEMASEEAGVFLGVLGGKIASKVLPKGAIRAFKGLKDLWVSGGAGRTAREFAERMATKAGFNGILEEYGEERLGALMRVGAGIDEQEGTTFEKIWKAVFPGWEQAFVELVAFSVPGVARAGVAKIFEDKPGKTTYSRRDMVRMFGLKQQTTKAERQELFDEHHPEQPETPVEAVETVPERVGVSDTEMESLLAEQAEVDEAEKPKPKRGKVAKEAKQPEVAKTAEKQPTPAKPKKRGKAVKAEVAEDSLEKEARKHKTAEDFVFAEKTVPIETVSTPVTREQIIEATGKIGSRTPDAPIVVKFEDGKIVIRDGNNRYYQKLDSGAKTIKVVFTPENDSQLTSIWNKAVSSQPAKRGKVKTAKVTTAEVVKPKRGAVIRDTDLTTAEEIRERRASIGRQVEKLESVRNPKDFDKHHAKIKKMHERRHDLAAKLKQVQKEEVKERKIEDEQEPIIEPTPSVAVDQGEAGEVVSDFAPTGKLNPESPAEALEITELHADWVNQGSRFETRVSIGGVFSTKVVSGEHVIDEVQYTSEQIDIAYRTVQTSIESPMADVKLYAMPGKEAELQAIATKMSKQKKLAQKKKKGKLPKPKPLPRAKVKTEDHVKAVNVASASESTRYALTGVKVEGNKMIATDGRRLFIAEGKWGKDGLYTNVTKEGKLGKATKKGNFPKYQDIIPEVSTRDAIIVDDLGLIWRRVQQASLVVTEDSKGIVLLVNKDGSLGFSSASPEVGHTEINIHPGAKILGGLNPDFLLDAIGFHAKRGDTSFELYFQNFERPMLTRSSDGSTLTVTMPVNVGEATADLKEAISDTGYGSQNTIVTKAEFEELKAEEAAAEPLKGKRGKGLRKGAVRTFTAQDFVRAGKFAVYHFEAGLRQFKSWSDQMIKTMGESARPHLEKLWAEAKKTVEEHEQKQKSPPVKTPKKAVAPAKEVKKRADQKSEPGKVKSKSVIANQMAETLKADGIALNIEYDPITIEEEVEKAQALVESNPDEARRISFSRAKVDNLLTNAVRLAYFNKMLDSNMDEAAKIANFIVTENTRLGQEIAVNRGFTGSPMEYVKQVVAAKMASVGKKFGRGKKGTGVKKVASRIKSEVAAVKEKTDAVKMNIANAQAFIESLEC